MEDTQTVDVSLDEGEKSNVTFFFLQGFMTGMVDVKKHFFAVMKVIFLIYFVGDKVSTSQATTVHKEACNCNGIITRKRYEDEESA